MVSEAFPHAVLPAPLPAAAGAIVAVAVAAAVGGAAVHLTGASRAPAVAAAAGV